ncbi:MAG: spore cortex biosynthesis protein YabQ [Clostridia bacterium]|nr:spore cortex biosynthesis protein YabQ [Clostridia bacterium]
MVVEQVYIFLWSVLIGAIMGVVFDFFRALRRKGNTRNIVVYLQDIVFWLIVAVIIITSSFILNNGDLRGYMLIGYLLGALLYMLLFSYYIKGAFSLILDIINKGFIFITKPINKLLEKMNKNEEKLEKKQEF